MSFDKQKTDEALFKLNRSIMNERKVSTCLSLWSKFIRHRDGQKCVKCGKKERISAHHIIRKCFLPEAQLMTGNGITLCSDCHKYMHEKFNRKPDISKPMDAQGGEKIELITALFNILVHNAKKRNILNQEYYFLSEQVLCKFKLFQGYDPFEFFPGTCIEQAFYIWNSCPLNTRNAILEASGLISRSEPFLPGITVFYE